MADMAPGKISLKNAQPKWPASIALIAIGFLHYALPSAFSFGPDWLLLLVIVLLLVPAILARKLERYDVSNILGYCILVLITAALVTSLSILIYRLPSHEDQPKVLLRAAAGLWISNILVFASWYWRLDGGGPHERDLRGVHTDGAFLFPQMAMDQQQRQQTGEACWSPGFVDYLFLAFNTSTAFSPTDAPVLSRWAKMLMMIQASISLATLAILAARAVNIL